MYFCKTEWTSYIISSGGEATNSYGFSFFFTQSTVLDSTKYQLIVSTSDKQWLLDLGDLKEQFSQWTYITFTWELNQGLKLYLQGNLTANVSVPQYISRGSRDSYTKLCILCPASTLPRIHLPTQIYDFSIWRKEISAFLVAFRFKNSKYVHFITFRGQVSTIKDGLLLTINAKIIEIYWFYREFCKYPLWPSY